MANSFKLVLNAAGLDNRAVTLAAGISADTWGDLETINEADKNKKLSGIIIHERIEADFNPQQIMMFPAPGSTVDGANGTPISLDNPDKAMVWSDEAGKEVAHYFYVDLIEATPKGRQLKAQIKAIDDATNERQGYSKELRALGKDGRKTMKADLTSEFNIYKNTFMNGIKLILQKRAFDTLLTGKIGYEIMRKADGSISGAAKPIKIFDASKAGGVSDVVSVSTFNSYDVDECYGNGGTFQALLDTVKRDGDGPKGDGINVDSFEEMESAVYALSSYLDKVGGDEKLEAALFKHLKAAGNGSFVGAIFKLNSFLDDYTVKPDLRKIADAA